MFCVKLNTEKNSIKFNFLHLQEADKLKTVEGVQCFFNWCTVLYFFQEQ